MNKTQLTGILEVVGRAIERNNLIPIYEFYCFTGETVFAFNDSFGIVAPCKVKTPFAIHGPTFLNLLKATKDDKIELAYDNDRLKIRAGGSEYDLPIKTQDEFVWQEPQFKPGGELDADLIKGIEYCIPTASENLALEAFSRVYIGEYKPASVPVGKLTVYSTDGDALTRYITTIDGKADVCVARAFAEAVIKTGGGKLVIGDEWVCSKFEDYKVYGRNLGPSTFDYEDYIGKILEGPVPELTPFPLKFDESLSRARVVADIETSPTTLFIENNQLTLLTETPFGEIFDTMKCKHPNIEVKVSAALMQKNMEGCDSFRVLDKCCVFQGPQLLCLVSNL
jgi:DNA polymerase III sliding clamp (beta) subunit (PCNA family)